MGAHDCREHWMRSSQGILLDQDCFVAISHSLLAERCATSSADDDWLVLPWALDVLFKRG